MGVLDKVKEIVAPIDDEGDDILEVEEEVDDTPRSRYERPKTINVNTGNTMKARQRWCFLNRDLFQNLMKWPNA